MSEKLKGQASKEQIAEWKEKYTHVWGVVVDGHIGYLRKPDRKILSAASAARKTSDVKSNEALLNNCWLGGSEEIRRNDDYFFSACTQLNELIEIKEAELVKL